ncbi:MAG TPA: transglutaminaseTgpA domain-containing protein, partial [Acidimicrobiales bacterium]|nr:transglutaminaseTgpA domain-containing protein [Acidimicrobiales bacterium]
MTVVDAAATRPSLIEIIRRANRPPPPEHSVLFRCAVGAAVLVGVAACQSAHELSPLTAVATIVAVAVGMAFSYVTRDHPWGWVKAALAVAVTGIFAVFVVDIVTQASAGNLASVEAPLAGLFAWVQVVHAFDVPARRDLLFSLAASAALIAVSGAQAISSSFGIYVAVWAVAAAISLLCSWRSMAGGGGRFRLLPLGASLLAATIVGAAIVAVLPAPIANRALTLPSALTQYLKIADPGGFAGGPSGAEPASPGLPGGRIGVGGFAGFAGPLDTALRGDLGNQVVLRVRATIPGYFVGATYDHWDGESWATSPALAKFDTLNQPSPFTVGGNPLPPTPGPTTVNVQTVYVASPMPNVVFSTAVPAEIYFPDNRLYVGFDGTIRSRIAMTPGLTYTVVSDDNQASAAELVRASDSVSPLGPSAVPNLAPDLQLPYAYPRVHALALAITSHEPTIYGKVAALEAWMSSHVRYSLDIPPLPRGADTVNSFLFGSRVGFCEQISTALTVMLRTIGIPAREATGYVPGPYNPLTDLYEIQAKDAHAWVQVWFPGFGWQSFDPTADVPLAPPDPGAILLHDLWHRLASLPWLVILPVGLGVVTEETVRRRWRARP